MSLFASIIAQGLAAIGQAAGEAALYSRGADSVAVTAVPGRAAGDLDDAGNVVVLSSLHDWIIKAADLVLIGATVLPKRGDRITVGGRVYETSVEGEQVYSWCDPGHTYLRIRTREVGAS